MIPLLKYFVSLAVVASASHVLMVALERFRFWWYDVCPKHRKLMQKFDSGLWETRWCDDCDTERDARFAARQAKLMRKP